MPMTPIDSDLMVVQQGDPINISSKDRLGNGKGSKQTWEYKENEKSLKHEFKVFGEDPICCHWCSPTDHQYPEFCYSKKSGDADCQKSDCGKYKIEGTYIEK